MTDPGEPTIVPFFQRLLPTSSLALRMALAIFEQDGMEGWLMVYIPPDKNKAPCEVMTSTHGWNLSIDVGTFNPRKPKQRSA